RVPRPRRPPPRALLGRGPGRPRRAGAAGGGVAPGVHAGRSGREPGRRPDDRAARPFPAGAAVTGVVVRRVPRPDAAAVAALERLGVATAHEAQGRAGLMHPYMRPVWRGARVAGRAVTALC